MSRYYFHYIDGCAVFDRKGRTFRDREAAKRYALRLGTELLLHPQASWQSSYGWQLLVTDAGNQVIARIKVSQTPFLLPEVKPSKTSPRSIRGIADGMLPATNVFSA